MPLRTADWENINRSLIPLYRELGTDKNLIVMLEVLNALVPADSLAIRINPVQQPSKMSWVSLPKHNASHEQTALIARYIHESPFAAYCLAPWKMTTDFISTEDFHKTDLHRLALGPIGVNHQILSGLGVREDRAYSAVLNRTHHGFSEHERDILDAVQPHLVTSFINAAAHGHASKAINQTQTALESAPGGYAYFNGEGQLVWIQARAKAWLNEFFEGEHLPDGGVPTAIRQLLQQSALNKDEVQIFECDGAAERLTAWFDSAELGGRVLRLERKPKTQAPHFRPLPQLSERKNEVLKWMVEGKRNAEIAAILGLSARTVENHVLEILRDMMVENRATAIVQAMDYCVAINNGKPIRSHAYPAGNFGDNVG